MKFNDFNWHDSIIKDIRIDRSNPGIIDNIIFEITWPEQKNVTTLIFEEVYWASLEFNFGFIASESILTAYEENDSLDLVNLYSKWKGNLDDIKLLFYQFELNTSGSCIKIIAKSFRFLDV